MLKRKACKINWVVGVLLFCGIAQAQTNNKSVRLLDERISTMRKSFEKSYSDLELNRSTSKNNSVISEHFAKNGEILLSLLESLEKQNDAKSRSVLEALVEYCHLEFYRIICKLDRQEKQQGALLRMLEEIYVCEPFRITLSKMIVLIFMTNVTKLSYDKKCEAMAYMLHEIEGQLLSINSGLSEKKVSDESVKNFIQILQACVTDKHFLKTAWMDIAKGVFWGTAIVSVIVLAFSLNGKLDRTLSLVNDKSNRIIDLADAKLDQAIQLLDGKSDALIELADDKIGQTITLVENKAGVVIDLTKEKIEQVVKLGEDAVKKLDGTLEEVKKTGQELIKAAGDRFDESVKTTLKEIKNNAYDVLQQTTAGAVHGLAHGGGIGKENLSQEVVSEQKRDELTEPQKDIALVVQKTVDAAFTPNKQEIKNQETKEVVALVKAAAKVAVGDKHVAEIVKLAVKPDTKEEKKLKEEVKKFYGSEGKLKSAAKAVGRFCTFGRYFKKPAEGALQNSNPK